MSNKTSRIQRQRGFTIVELLIVIVVIAILAVISIVAYSGIQGRARVSQVQTEMSSLGKQIAIYQVDNAAFPTANAAWAQVFKAANLWDSTRDGVAKSFAICANSNQYAVVAAAPVSSQTSGSTNYMITQSGLSTFAWDTSTTGATTLERMCRQTSLPYPPTYLGWAHGLT